VSNVGPEGGKKLRERLRSSTAAGYKGTSYDLVRRCSSQCEWLEHAIGRLNPPVERRPHPATQFHLGTTEVGNRCRGGPPTGCDGAELVLRSSLASAESSQWKGGRSQPRFSKQPRVCCAGDHNNDQTWRGVGHLECSPNIFFDGASWRVRVRDALHGNVIDDCRQFRLVKGRTDER